MAGNVVVGVVMVVEEVVIGVAVVVEEDVIDVLVLVVGIVVMVKDIVVGVVAVAGKDVVDTEVAGTEVTAVVPVGVAVDVCEDDVEEELDAGKVDAAVLVVVVVLVATVKDGAVVEDETNEFPEAGVVRAVVIGKGGCVANV